jgi:hypothetical protein
VGTFAVGQAGVSAEPVEKDPHYHADVKQGKTWVNGPEVYAVKCSCGESWSNLFGISSAYFDWHTHRLERDMLVPSYLRLLARLHLDRDERIGKHERTIITKAFNRTWSSALEPVPFEWLE